MVGGVRSGSSGCSMYLSREKQSLCISYQIFKFCVLKVFRNMSKDKEALEPPLTFTLKVHNSTIPCSKRIVLSSSLLVDVMELIKDDTDRFAILL